MKERGMDGRRDKRPPKIGEIRQKRGDTLNESLLRPIPGFPARTRVDTMRDVPGKASVEAVSRAAKHKR
jgi:hypothetical protein